MSTRAKQATCITSHQHSYNYTTATTTTTLAIPTNTTTITTTTRTAPTRTIITIGASAITAVCVFVVSKWMHKAFCKAGWQISEHPLHIQMIWTVKCDTHANGAPDVAMYSCICVCVCNEGANFKVTCRQSLAIYLYMYVYILYHIPAYTFEISISQ